MYINQKYIKLIAQEAFDKGFFHFYHQKQFVKINKDNLKKFPIFYKNYIELYNLDETKFLEQLNER